MGPIQVWQAETVTACLTQFMQTVEWASRCYFTDDNKENGAPLACQSKSRDSFTPLRFHLVTVINKSCIINQSTN